MANEKCFQIMEDVFSDYLNKKINISSLEKKLSILLGDFCDNNKKFEVSVIPNSMNDVFFGLRIFPIVDELLSMTSWITTEKVSMKEVFNKWKNITKWYVEIDINLFSRVVNFTPKELVSMTIHEIGHTVISDSVVEQFYRAYKESFMRMTIADKASQKFLYMLYTIPFALSCTTHSWYTGKNGIREEIFADKYVIDNGYGEHLATALGKIIKEFGTSVEKYDDASISNTLNTSVKWCNTSIGDVVKRKNTLKDSLHYQAVRANSGYIKMLSYKILNILGIKLREKYTGNAVESLDLNILCNENFFKEYTSHFDNKTFSIYERNVIHAYESSMIKVAMEAKTHKEPPSQYDIDAIAVEIDRITNHHDRIYVLDLIYNKIEELEEFSELMEHNSMLLNKYENKVKNMLISLDLMRETVLAKKKFDTNYTLFVKYPEGYEG